MTRVCSGCGLGSCSGECFHKCALDFPDDPDICIGCDKPFDANGYCSRCEEYRFGTIVQSDPLKDAA